MSAQLAFTESGNSPPSTALQKPSPDKMSGSHKDREARGRALAARFVDGLGTIVVKFIGDLATEITEVRQDFEVKPKTELICGVATFTEYCTGILGYSLRHIDRILEGHNPSLSDAENADARQRKATREIEAGQRKAKRQLDAKVTRNQKALPIRAKTNAEILADKKEKQTTDDLKKQVTVLTNKLQAASTKACPAAPAPAAEKDLQKIHASEVKQLDTEIAKLNASIKTLTVAHKKLRVDAVRLATAAARAKPSAHLPKLADKFLAKYGWGVKK